MFERIDGIIRRADCLDVIVLHQPAGMVFGFLKQVRTVIVNLPGCRRIQQFRDTERRFQFEVRPVIQRIAHRVGNRLGPLFEFLPVGRILAGTVTFVNTVGTHRTPLVVVTLQPDFREILELVIGSHIFGNQVAMVIDNRHLSRMFVVETLRSRCLQQEVVVIELFHVSIQVVFEFIFAFGTLPFDRVRPISSGKINKISGNSREKPANNSSVIDRRTKKT